MFRAYLIEMTLLALACWFLFWGATKLYFIIKHEASADRRLARQLKREVDDAAEELDHTVRKAVKSRNRNSK